MTPCDQYSIVSILALLALPASAVVGFYGAVLIYRKYRANKRPRSRVRETHIYKP